jgi:hypothetical protein
LEIPSAISKWLKKLDGVQIRGDGLLSSYMVSGKAIRLDCAGSLDFWLTSEDLLLTQNRIFHDGGLGDALQPAFLQGFDHSVSLSLEYQYTWWQDANFNAPTEWPLFNSTFARQDDVVKFGFVVSLSPPARRSTPSKRPAEIAATFVRCTWVVNGTSRRVASPHKFGRKRGEADIQRAAFTMLNL